MRLRSSHPSVRSIQAEHDLLNAVIQAMVQIVRTIDKGGKAPEDKILTTAVEVLIDEDWKKLDAAFTNHEDPLIGGQYKGGMDKLFSLIVNLAPSPIGVVPAL